MFVRAHNMIRARYVSSAYMMHGSETLYVTMLLQLFVRPVECPRAYLHKFEVSSSHVDCFLILETSELSPRQINNELKKLLMIEIQTHR